MVFHCLHLFQAPKNTPDEVAAAASSCFKLNSLQLQSLLMKYQYEPDEVPIPPEVLDNVVRVSVLQLTSGHSQVIVLMTCIASPKL